MTQRSTKRKVFQYILSISLILLCFIAIFLAKCTNNLENKGYFHYDVDSNGRGYYKQVSIRNVSNVDMIEDEARKLQAITDLYFYVDGAYYQAIPEENTKVDENTGEIITEITYNISIIEVIELESKPDIAYRNKLVILKSRFFSKNNLLTTLGDITLWIITVTIAVANVVIELTMYYLRRDENIDSEECQTVLNTYNDRVKLKPVNFDEFIAENNRDEKKKVYMDIHSAELMKIKRKILTNTNNPRKLAILNAKKEVLIQQLTPEFIEENIDSIDVRYNKLHAENYQLNMYEKNINFRKDYSAEGAKVSMMSIKQGVSSLISFFLFSAITIELYLTFALDASFWLILIAAVGALIMSGMKGLRQGDRIYRSDILGVLKNKTAVLEDSIKWGYNHPTDKESYEAVLEAYYAERIKAESDKLKDQYNEKLQEIQSKLKKFTN